MDALERSELLGQVSAPASRFLKWLIPGGALKDALSGTWLGHPLHPLLVGLPIGSWVAAGVLDLTLSDRKAARRLVGLGILSSLPTVVAGLSDWSDTTGGPQRVGAVHAGLNSAALVLYTGSWMARRRGGGRALALGGAGVLACAGYLGGHLSYALGVGVDTTTFDPGPSSWRALAREADLVDGRPHQASVDGVSVMLLRRDGRVRAVANRCTHRGGPLAEGTLEDGCVTCPWHASRFDLDTGAVRRGPATRPQPVFEARMVAGTVEVRRKG